MYKNVFFLLITLSLSLMASLQADEIVYKNYPFSVQAELDGKDNEKVWSKIKFSDLFSQINGKSSKFKTSFKVYSDKKNLFVFIKIQDQDLKALLDQNIKKKTANKDHFVIYLAPFPRVDDHYKISINYEGKINSSFIPAKAGHGFPYSAKVNHNWKSKTECGIFQNEGYIGLELKIPVAPLGLQKNIFHKFGMNIVRYASYEEILKNKKKRLRKEASCWGKIRGELWNTRKFGGIVGPLFKDKSFTGKWDLNDLDQMTNGMTALLKSLDIYYKATISYKYYVPEGTEVNGDIGNFDHVPIPQYTVKADGYYRFYKAYKYQPYKDLGNHIINKLYKGYSETKDANGKHYLIWNNLMAEDGKVHGYGSGPKMGLYKRGRIPFNQSDNKFFIKGVVFQEALGQGFYDLSQIQETLDPEIKNKIIEMLSGTLEFLHQPYVLIDKNDEYYWRVDAFSTLSPKAYDKKLNNNDWQYIGMDIVLMTMALHNFDKNLAQPYLKSMEKFAAFYTKKRLSVSGKSGHGPHHPHNIYKLDHRMLSLSSFAKEQKLSTFDFLNDWQKKNLPTVYSKIPKVEYSENGATKNSWSTLGVLEIFRELNDKSQHQTFWKKCFTDNMTPLGLYQEHRVVPMNFSSYPLYFDYAKNAYTSKVLSEEEYITVVKKMFYLYGNSKLHRNNIKYAVDLLPEHRTRPMWGNTPYDCYVEGVLPEGIYANGSSQAFYSIFGNYSINEFFKTRAEHARYEYNFRYYQYTAPFQFHSDRYSYGKAESITLVEMQKSTIENSDLKAGDSENEKIFEVTVTTPMGPKGLPVFGHLDISGVIFKNQTATQPTDLKIKKVEMDQKEISFKDYHIMEYKRILSKEDKAKLVFGFISPGPNQKCKIKVTLKKKYFKQYFAMKPKGEGQ